MTFSQIWNNGFISRIIFPSPTSLIVVTLLSGLAVAVCSYLLGSINLAIILSDRFYGEDIRSFGSGNAGMTNVMRTYGKKMAVITFLGDFLKAVVASLIGRAVLGVFGAYLAGFFCFLGHLYPCFYKFKGGKGVVTTCAMVLMTDWRVFLVLFVIFVIIVASTKYVSLGSVVGVMFYPIVLDRVWSIFGCDDRQRIVMIFVLGVMVLTLWKHRENLKRISKGTENKFTFKVKDKMVGSSENQDDSVKGRRTARGNQMKNSSPLITVSRCDVSAEERLDALRKLKKMIDEGSVSRDRDGSWVNNHIHTCYSFSPYTPSSAVFYAWKAGLGTAGIMDHDSVGGAREFIEAGKIMEMPVTCGFECRVNVKGTALEGRRINNPDQLSCAYLAMHGIPHQNIDKAEAVLKGVREKRNERNRRMTANISDLVSEFGLSLDFDRDVYPISMAREGGSITERHLLFALTEKIVEKYPERNDAIGLVEKLIGKKLDEKTEKKLLEAPENFYKYDVLGVLKSSLVSKFYVDADEECMNIAEFTALADKLGAISAYAYLGDVSESPTGDKKAQKFEDEYLPILFEELKRNNFKAVTYMPSRNTKEQLAAVMKMCRDYSLFEISGEDINSPRQSFICEAIADPAYEHLVTSTYALIGHEKAASADVKDSMFSDKTKAKYPDLPSRVDHYAGIGGLKK